MGKRLEKIVSWALIAALTVQPALLHAQNIQVVGPDDGPRPHVDQSYNGTTVINIGTPNGAGVSHDIYTAFTAGDLILNNAPLNVNTQLGGWIEGNPNLAPGQAADLWIGEVVGGNQTQLNGILEVGGQTMDVVLANEFGITCKGCGFVNTGRATLTTGTPRFGSDGSLSGFDVKQGTVTIGSGGLNPESRLSLADTSRVDVIARAAAIYGAMRADQLNVVAGANIVDYNWSYDPQTGAVTGITEQTGTGASPALAVDVAALGGMYANAIQLVATENGVGVRLDGEMASSTNIALRSDGRLTLGAPSGGHVPQIKAKEQVMIRNQAPVLLEGSITSENGRLIDIRTSSGTLTFTGQADGGAITLESAGLANIEAAITASAALKVRSLTDAVTLGGGAAVSAASIDVDAATSAALNGKATATGAITVDAGTILTTGAASELSGNSIALNGQSVIGAGDATAVQGLTVAAGTGGASNSGSLAGTDVTLTSAAALQNDGKISAGAVAQLTAATTLATGAASETFGNDVTLSSASATLDGVIKADDALSITTTSGDLIVSGTLAGNSTTLTSAADLTNSGAIAGTVSAALTATDTLTISAGSELSGGDIDLTGRTITTNGTAIATITLDLDAATGGIDNGGALIGPATTLTSDAGIVNRGTVTGTNTATLAGATTLEARIGSAIYGDAIALRGASVITDGVANAGQTLNITAGTGGTTNSGSLGAPVTTITSESAISNTGVIAAGTTLRMDAATALTNAATLISGDDLAIYADQILNNGGVIWANDSITLAANAALDRASLVQNTGGRIEAFQGDLTIRANEVANLGTAPTIGASEIIKWLEQGNSGPIDPVEELSKLIDVNYLDADGHILPAYAADYAALWADVIIGGGTLSTEAQSILKPSVLSPSGTALKGDFAGLWEDMFAKANADGTPDPAALVRSMVDPAIFDANGIVLPAHADAYAALWVTLASGGTSVSNAVKAILDPSALVVESTQTDPVTGVVTTTYSNTLVSDNTDVWAAMSAGSSAAYDIVKILYQDRFNNDGKLAEMVAGGTVDISANEVRNIFGNISAGEDLFITANSVTNQAMGASQVLLEVHKKPGCFACHEGEVDFYDTFGGRIEAVGNVAIAGSLSNVTLNSSELTLQDVMDEMNAYIQEQQAAGDADLAAVPLVALNNFHFEEHRENNYTAPVAGNGTDIRTVAAVDTGTATPIDTGGGTPTVIPLDPGRYRTSVAVVTSVTPTLTPTASVDALLAAGLNTIAEMNPEFAQYGNFITSNYMMDVNRLQYRDELVNNTSETILAALNKADVIVDVGALDYLNQPIAIPAADGSGLTTVYPAAARLTLDSRGALIRGTNVAVSGDAIDNSGAVLASVNASITANTITGRGGSIVADAGEVALTAFGRIDFEDVKIDGASVDIIAGQDFTGKAVSISSATDTSIFAVTGVTLTALQQEFALSRAGAQLTATSQQLSSLTVGGDLSIVTSGDLVLAGLQGDVGGSTLLSAGRDLRLSAVQSEAKFQSGDARNGTDIYRLTSEVTRLTSGADFVATAGGSALLVGTQIDAGGTAQLAAAEDVVLAAAQDIYTYETRSSRKSGLFGFKKRSSSHAITQLTNQGVAITAASDVDVIAEAGDLTTAGTSFVSNDGDINFSAVQGAIYAGTYTDIFTDERKTSRSSFWGLSRKSSQSTSAQQFNTGTDALAALDLSLVSGEDTTLVGATLSAGQNLTINTGGDFSVQAALDSQRSAFFSSNMGLVTMTTIQERSFVETAVFTQLLAGQGINLGIGGEAELVVYTQSGVDAPRPENLYPEELLALDGLNLLTQDLANEYFYDKQTSLSPAFKALVSIALSVYAPGLGSGLLNTLGVANAPAWLVTGAQAFSSSAIIGTADGIVSGDFDLGEILEGAAFSGVTAGLTAGINLDTTFGIDTGKLGDVVPSFGSGQLTWSGLLESGLDGVISSGLSSAVYGTDFGDGVLSSMVNYIANGAAGAGIEEVADRLGHDTFSVEKLIAKATINCLAAEAKGASCASGAMGSLVAELVLTSGASLGASDMDDFRNRLELVAALGGFFVSGGEAANVNAAAMAAVLDYDNNCLGPAAIYCGYLVAAAIFGATVADVVITAVEAEEIASLGMACQQTGDRQVCDAFMDKSKEFAIEAGISWGFGAAFPGDKAIMAVLGMISRRGGDDVARAVDEIVEVAAARASNAGDVPQITRNRLHHEQKVGEVVDDLEARGYQVDTEVSFRGCDTTRRCRADVVARDENGRVAQVVEVKTGDAGPSPNQAEIYPQVANGDAIPTGQVAERLGLRPGVPLRDQGYPNGIPVEVRTFEGVNQ